MKLDLKDEVVIELRDIENRPNDIRRCYVDNYTEISSAVVEFSSLKEINVYYNELTVNYDIYYTVNDKENTIYFTMGGRYNKACTFEPHISAIKLFENIANKLDAKIKLVPDYYEMLKKIGREDEKGRITSHYYYNRHNEEEFQKGYVEFKKNCFYLDVFDGEGSYKEQLNKKISDVILKQLNSPLERLFLRGYWKKDELSTLMYLKLPDKKHMSHRIVTLLMYYFDENMIKKYLDGKV
jgi:hypothetical protein